MTRSIHRDADTDLITAFRYYKSEAGIAIARRVLDEFERVARLIEDNSGLGAQGGDGRRNHPLSVYP